MLHIERKVIFSTLFACITIYGGSTDEWILVGRQGPRKKITTQKTLYPTKKDSYLEKPSLSYTKEYSDASTVPSLTYQVSQPKILSFSKPISISKIVPTPNIIQILPATHKTPSKKSTFEKMSLHFAALHNDNHTLQDLISEGSDICATDINGATALHWAAGNGQTAAAKTILNYEDGFTCLGMQDNEGKTPLHRAAGIKSDTIFVLLQKAPRKIIDLRDKDGSTALLWATSAGRLEAVKALITKGANVNAQDYVRGRTPLHWALRMRIGSSEKGGEHMPAKTSQAIIKYLVEHNANTTLTDKEGYDPLYWACRLNLKAEIALLTNKAVDCYHPNRIYKKR